MTCTPDLFTTRLEETIAFYTKVLGFTVETLWPEEGPSLCILDRGQASVMFHTDRWDGEEESQLTGQIRIDVDDCLAMHAAVLEHPDADILWGPDVYEYGRREFSVRDPNGYRLVLSEVVDGGTSCEGQ